MNALTQLGWTPLRSPRLTTATTVLVPGPLGALRLFHRRGGGTLRRRLTVVDPDELHAFVAAQPGPHDVVLCGSRYRHTVAAAVAGHTDLYVVPTPWLRRIDLDDLDGRAECAASLATAHRTRPIERIYGRQLDFPF